MRDAGDGAALEQGVVTESGPDSTGRLTVAREPRVGRLSTARLPMRSAVRHLMPMAVNHDVDHEQRHEGSNTTVSL
jgi:hypothetical protein